MPESHTPDESRSAPSMGITDIKPVDLINVDMEDHGWRYDRLRTVDEGYTEFFYRGPDTLTMGWAWSQDPSERALHLLSPIHINDTEWPVSSPTDVTRALEEDRRLAQPLSTIYDTSPRRHTPLELYHLRDEITEQLAEFRPELHEPTTGVDAGRSRTLDLDPDLPPWETDHDGVVVDDPPQRQPIEPGDPDWPPWLSTEPLWDPPSQDTGGMGEAPEAASEEPSNPRGYSIRDLTAAVRDSDPWTWGNTALTPPGTPEPRPRVMRVTLPDGRTAYMEAPAPTEPEEWYSPDVMRVQRGGEVPASQRFAAMDPELVEAARGLLRDYPDTLPFEEVGRRGLTFDDVSLVYAADIGDLPDATTTDPWRAPPAAPWQPATTAPDPHHDGPQRDRERAVSAADVVHGPDSGTTLERPGPDAAGGDPETTAIRTALDRLVDGQITDDDLARIGLTPGQAERLVSADVNADIDRAPDEHPAEPAADAESTTTQLLPDREYVDPVYASLTQEDHEANRRAAYDAWTSTVRREWAERARAWSDTGQSRIGEPGLTSTAADNNIANRVADRGGRPVASASDDASGLNNGGDVSDFGVRREVIGDDVTGDSVVGGVVGSTDLGTPDGESGVRRLTSTERDLRVRQVSSDGSAADPHAGFQHRLDRLQDRLNGIQQALHTDLDQALDNTIQGIHHSFAPVLGPTSDASTDTSSDTSTRRGRHVSPDISDGLDPPYGYPADTATTDLADPRYQQSEIDPGPNIEI
jgi:hypothetical protein